MTADSETLAEAEVDLLPLPCVGHPGDDRRVLPDLPFPGEGTSQVIVGGGCLQGDDRQALERSGHFVLAPSLCFHLLAPAPLVDGLIAEGAYLMTPGWLSQWERHLLDLGFDREAARDFFRESISTLVLLDTDADRESQSRLSAMGDYLGLPVRTIPVGLDLLRLNLENLSIRIFREREATASRDRYFADHFMVIDQMNELLSSESEAQAFARVKELFSQLFAPGRMAWIPREEMPPFPEAGGATYRTGSGRGFGILFRHRREDLGVMELDDLAFAQYTERYLALAGPLSNVCAMAIANARIVEERDKAREAMLRAARIVESSDDAIIGETLDGTIVSWNRGATQIFDHDQDQVIGQSTAFLVPDGQSDEIPHLLDRIRAGQPVGSIETVWKTRDGRRLNVSVQVSPIVDGKGRIAGASCIVRDVTEEKRKIEKERASLNAQLQQARKLESIGRLAGGVAHDFNNMLGVILGFSEMALEKVGAEDPVHSDLMEIQTAANRSANITRQLLAFARKQTIAPVAIDLNETVGQSKKMLRRLIGEDIDLAWHPQPGLWKVRLDPSQIDQILVNLCVNARDAIDGVGKVTLETKTVTFDAEYCAYHLGFAPGEFVMLAFSDDGCGMDGETLNQIFEPFFTTKGVGKGTGLGLATVYGIVRQNDGFINVYSEPDKGTTFKIYLPRFLGESAESRRVAIDEAPLGRGETVLVVEDEPATLNLIRSMLGPLHYTVLPARTPSEAVRLAEADGGRIALLITDVVMPEMNGRQLYERLKAMLPDLKCLFMSGYTSNVIAHRGILDDGVNFISKPFFKRELAVKVRVALGDGGPFQAR